MSGVDPRLVAAVREQLSRRPYGAARIGWKYGDLAGEASIEEVTADNDYHRAVAFGPFVDVVPPRLEGALVVNGEPRAAGPAPEDIGERVAAVGRVLAAAGERLQPGDRIITGLIVNTPVRAGDDVEAELGGLGQVRLSVA